MNEVKSLRHFKYFILIAKIQGLFLHRNLKKNLVNPVKNDNNRLTQYSFEDFFSAKNIHEKTRINRFHLVYCIFAFLFYNSLNILSFYINLTDSNSEISVNSSDSSMRNETTSYNFKINFNFFFKLASVLNFSILLVCFFIFTLLKDGFYKCLVRNEYLDRKLIKLYNDFNQSKVSKAEKIFYKSGGQLLKFTLLYLFIAISLQTGYFFTLEKFDTLLIISKCFNFTIMVIIVYFVFSKTFLIYYQMDSLYRYICSLQNQYFDISAFNLIHIELYKHFKISMKYISLLYSFIYSQYFLQDLSNDLSLENFTALYDFGQSLVAFILPVTILGILFTYKVSSF